MRTPEGRAARLARDRERYAAAAAARAAEEAQSAGRGYRRKPKANEKPCCAPCGASGVYELATDGNGDYAIPCPECFGYGWISTERAIAHYDQAKQRERA